MRERLNKYKVMLVSLGIAMVSYIVSNVVGLINKDIGSIIILLGSIQFVAAISFTLAKAFVETGSEMRHTYRRARGKDESEDGG